MQIPLKKGSLLDNTFTCEIMKDGDSGGVNKIGLQQQQQRKETNWRSIIFLGLLKDWVHKGTCHNKNLKSQEHPEVYSTWGLLGGAKATGSHGGRQSHQ